MFGSSNHQREGGGEGAAFSHQSSHGGRCRGDGGDDLAGDPLGLEPVGRLDGVHPGSEGGRRRDKVHVAVEVVVLLKLQRAHLQPLCEGESASWLPAVFVTGSHAQQGEGGKKNDTQRKTDPPVEYLLCTCCDVVGGDGVLQLRDGLPLFLAAERQLHRIGLLRRLVGLYALKRRANQTFFTLG